MSEPVVRDPAVAAIALVINALADAYDPASSYPPEQGSTTVHFFAGEGPATAAWDAHTNETDCDKPFLWVRVMRRFRTRGLPTPSVEPNPCRSPRAIAVEVGVARCAVVAENPSWDDYEAEGALSLEDSWRMEMALCAAASRLQANDYLVTTDEITPYGPEGGIIAWTGIVTIQFDS